MQEHFFEGLFVEKDSFFNFHSSFLLEEYGCKCKGFDFLRQIFNDIAFTIQIQRNRLIGGITRCIRFCTLLLID
ncbi:hypothetical protein D0T49_10485 [Paludibacter sp. 221]|nr:hypothetical protein [Paludibacter sp. 221]